MGEVSTMGLWSRHWLGREEREEIWPESQLDPAGLGP